MAREVGRGGFKTLKHTHGKGLDNGSRLPTLGPKSEGQRESVISRKKEY